MTFVTKNDYIYEKLKDEIIDRRLRPGERIVIPDVTKRYGVSAMPIREALSRLQQDGLIEIIPHVGARVMSFNLDIFKEIMMIRTELESLATKMATPYIDEVTMDKLQVLYEEMAECSKTKDYIKYGKVNKEFHMTIYTAGPYHILSDLIASLWARSEFSRTVFTKASERLQDSQAEHLGLLEAIKAGDSDKAGRILHHQKESANAKLISLLEKGEIEKEILE